MQQSLMAAMHIRPAAAKQMQHCEGSTAGSTDERLRLECGQHEYDNREMLDTKEEQAAALTEMPSSSWRMTVATTACSLTLRSSDSVLMQSRRLR